MEFVALAALGVGGSTVFGAILGFFLKRISHRFSDALLGFAAGVMLSAAIFGLFLPALEKEGVWNAAVVVFGILAGAFFLSISDKFMPTLGALAGAKRETERERERLNRVLLFVFAIALHNLPEGIAAGLSFGTGHTEDAVTVVVGIILQNIPEGMVIIAPMLSAGIGRFRTLCIAVCTGLIEVIGTFIGYYATAISSALLPFLLAFAGGTMLYVVSDEMIPESHSDGFEKAATFSLIFGFALMLFLNVLLSAF